MSLAPSATVTQSSPVPPHPKLIVLFGATGQLGGAIKRLFPAAVCIPWSNAQSFHPESLLTGNTRKPAIDFIFANGLTHSKAPELELLASNYEFPKRFVEKFFGLNIGFQQSAGDPLCRFLTFGTVTENFPEMVQANSYIRSKKRLRDWVETQANEHPRMFRHIQLHTLYGGLPAPHMFLGQIAGALQNDAQFEMSSGEQLREYHHIDDIARSVAALLAQDWGPNEPILTLSSGSTVQLRVLAQEIFSAFGKADHLKIGALGRNSVEIMDQVYAPSDPSLLVQTRDPVKGVIGFLREFLATSVRKGL